MKLIILDYFRRWWLALGAIFIGYIIFQVISIRDTNSQTASEGVEATVNHTIGFVHNIFVFQVVICGLVFYQCSTFNAAGSAH